MFRSLKMFASGSTAALLVVMLVSIAAARPLHVSLTKAEPGINDTVTASPTAIKLWFSGPIQAAVTGARVTGPGDHAVTLGVMRVDTIPKMPAVAAITETLKSGTYTVTWRTMAADGHPANGTFVFVVRLAAGQH